jgi:predicted amidohydrolase
MPNLKVTIIQPDIIWENKISNLLKYENDIKLITSNPDVIILPEMFTTGFTMENRLAETCCGYTTEWMQIMSLKKDAHIMGSITIYDKGEIKPFNRLLCVKDQSIEYYDKKHLFAYADEDKFYTAGNQRKIVTINGWRILLQICYDLRFPVFSRNQDDYDAIVYVANWPAIRSLAWKTLLQARAIENQCYVIGVNRVGTDGNGHVYSGDSQVIDPLGNVLCLSNKPDVKDFELNEKCLHEVRNQLPFLKDRDLFELKNHS